MRVVRGEKLYVTKDSRDKKSCKKPVCWGLTLTLLAAAIFVVVLLSSELHTHLCSPDATLGAAERMERWAPELVKSNLVIYRRRVRILAGAFSKMMIYYLQTFEI
jgi:hypothetical protein